MAQLLTDLFYRAEREQKTATFNEIYFEVEDKLHMARITVAPLQEPASLKGMPMVVFAEAAVPEVRPRKPRAGKLQPDARSEELIHPREEHQSTHEEMQTLRKSSNHPTKSFCQPMKN